MVAFCRTKFFIADISLNSSPMVGISKLSDKKQLVVFNRSILQWGITRISFLNALFKTVIGGMFDWEKNDVDIVNAAIVAIKLTAISLNL